MKSGTSRNRIALNAAKNNAELRSRSKTRSIKTRRKSARKRDADEGLKRALDPLFAKYHQAAFLGSDPLEFPHRFVDPWDQEAVALFSAVLAYGKVAQIRRSVEDLLARIASLGLSPAALVRSVETEAGAAAWDRALAGFVHRFNVGADFGLFTRLLARSWRLHGSFGAHLVAKMEPEAADFGPGLSALFSEWEEWRKDFPPAPASFAYLLTPPELGSACKRWCMLLRWMGRKDALDLGLWRAGSRLLPSDSPGIEARQLVMPLDTHTGRISQYLGLTDRKSLGWQAAVEITERLRSCDPEDPVKYDFALARLGILELCQRRFRVEICGGCDLLPVCRFARKGLSSRASRSTSSSS
ncbi:MAG: TIGR02757 family protein [Bdellovibrionales bacterium]|nr:TIGR02757 family protein [Bdellovibrionales bacterium]